MSSVATFNYALFIASFPEFASVPELTVVGYWTMAEGLHSNDGCGPVSDDNVQTQLMNLVTAFLAAQFSTPAGGSAPANSPVGRIASASQGSVSVSLEMMSQSESASFWNQNKYGALYWRMILPYRLGRYRSMYQRTGGVPPRS